MTAAREIVLVSNGPGELYTWLRPTLRAVRARDPDVPVKIVLVPCQFASGYEARIAETFGADLVVPPTGYVRSVPGGRAPEGLGAARGVVLQLGGNVALGARLARVLGHPLHRYAFTTDAHAAVARLYLPDDRTAGRARRRGTAPERLAVVGNLVADAVQDAEPVPDPGAPHVLVIPGSRDAFAKHLIPLMIEVVDRLGRAWPGARFVWPVSRLLSIRALEEGIAGRFRRTLGGVSGTHVAQGVRTPNGALLETVKEEERYAHMRSADLALTIPGTNTLELGIAGVPSVVTLPLNQPELIPLEGAGHWLGLVPLVGRYLKRAAVRAWVQGLDQPVSLPNRIADDRPFREIHGHIDPATVAASMRDWWDDESDRARVRARLAASMPAPGAAARVADSLLHVLEAPP